VLKAKTCGVALPPTLDPWAAPAKVAKWGEPPLPSASYAAERAHKLALQQLDAASQQPQVDVERIKGLQGEEQGRHRAWKEAETERMMGLLSQGSGEAHRFKSLDFNKDDAQHM